MKLNASVEYIVTPVELANTLASCEPKQFADVFLKLSTNKKFMANIDSYAAALSPDMGGNAKKVLKELVKHITYHEVKNETNVSL